MSEMGEDEIRAFLLEGTRTGKLGSLTPSGHRIAARYVSEERAAEYGRRNAVPGELVLRLTPERVIAVRDLAD